MNDLEQAAFKGIVEVIKDTTKSIVGYGIEKAKDKVGELIVEYEIGFRSYLDTAYKRFSRVKTLVNRTVPVSFERIYVNVNVAFDKAVSEAHIQSIISKRRLVVISGLAGSGKSMLLRRTFIRYLKSPKGRIPFFVELRDIDAINKQSIENYILKEVKESCPLTAAQFLHGMQAGKFIFMFDGIDEVAPFHRASVCKQIVKLGTDYDEMQIICTSRPDDDLFMS